MSPASEHVLFIDLDHLEHRMSKNPFYDPTLKRCESWSKERYLDFLMTLKIITDRNAASHRYIFYVMMKLAHLSKTFLNEMKMKVRKTSPMESWNREALYADLVLLFSDKDNTFLHP